MKNGDDKQSAGPGARATGASTPGTPSLFKRNTGSRSGGGVTSGAAPGTASGAASVSPAVGSVGHSHHSISTHSISGAARALRGKADYTAVASLFDSTEIDFLQKTFCELAKRSADATMDKETFLRYFHLPGLIGEQLFVAFDTKNTGVIDLEEFLMGMAVVLRGNADSRAKLLFRMFNLDADEGVSAQELKTMLLTYFSAYTLIEAASEKANALALSDRIDGGTGEDAAGSGAQSGSPSSSNGHVSLDTLYLEYSLMEQNVLDMLSDAFRNKSMDSKLSYDEFSAWIRKHPRVVDFVFRDPSIIRHQESLNLSRSRKQGKGKPEMSGWLGAASKKGIKRFTQRYYVLAGVYLFKYHEKNDDVPKDAIFMPGALVKPFDSSNSSVHGGTTVKEQLMKGNAEEKSDKSRRSNAASSSKPQSRNEEGSGDKSPTPIRSLTKSFGSANIKGFGIEISWDNGYSRVLFADTPDKQKQWLKKLRRAAENRDISSYYTLESEHFAKGAFSKVVKAKQKRTGVEFAVKVVSKQGLDAIERQGLLAEVAILETSYHPNVMSLENVFEDSTNLYIVMELCEGGNLLQFIEQSAPVCEHVARGIIVQILHGLGYLHSMGIIYRDMKPNNILLSRPAQIRPCVLVWPENPVQDQDPTSPPTVSEGRRENTEAFHGELKIVDFGYSKFVRPKDRLNEGVGTFKYWPPEMAKGLSEYSKPVDVWGVGIIMYRLVVGAFPFIAKEGEDLLHLIAQRPYVTDNERYRSLSESCKDLLDRMLRKKPEDRITVEETQKHPWLAACKYQD
ncbi:Death-associated protein kinase 3 [Porphyridium purpureum]|uniref:Death-associated protein kinase 3 n=1 Tax=Porphyridium purpureum TaxID=35688 RepID=A0A5J4Z9M6_PORPP|nr:Death-associated protein kinase 3 [Porphyridium purpureum]|eukprot:POR0177..scf295_1